MVKKRIAKKVFVIIPAYNEERNIDKVVGGIKRTLGQVEVVVINDGSSDRTEEKALSGGATVINHFFNMGYGVALQTGYKYAFRNGADYLVQIDGDGQHNPKDIPKVLKLVVDGKSDLVVGSRFLGKCDYQIPLIRRLGMKFFGGFASLITGKKVTDPTSGFQAMNRKVLEFFTKGHYPVDFPDADILILLHFQAFKTAEIPVTMTANIEGRSMHRGLFKPMYYLFKMVLSIFMAIIRRKTINQ